MKVRSSINVKIYWVQAGGDDLHTSLLTIQPGFISGGAGEDEWNTILKDAFINSVKASFKTADFCSFLTRKWESLDEKKQVNPLV